MTHPKCFSPWAIVRLLPDKRWVIVGRFRTRSDAEGHTQVLKRLIPTARFVVVFDIEEQS